MIRYALVSDLSFINKLLNEFNFSLDEKFIDNEFLRVIIHQSKCIDAVLIYDLIYDRIEIEYIIVNKENRRCGLATHMINFIEKENKNINNITLEVRQSNKEALEFYKKNGFEVVTVRKNYYNNEDGLLLIKKIGE